MNAVLILAAVLAAGSVIAGYVNHRKAKRLKEQRAPTTAEGFAAYFADEQIPPQLCRQVYGYLQGCMNVRAFPVLPTDSLGEVYGFVPGEDWEDAFNALSPTRKYRNLTYDEQVELMQVVTAADLVRFLHRTVAARV